MAVLRLYPISMLVQNTDRGWLIDQVVTGSYVEPEWIFYLNKEYGFACIYHLLGKVIPLCRNLGRFE